MAKFDPYKTPHFALYHAQYWMDSFWEDYAYRIKWKRYKGGWKGVGAEHVWVLREGYFYVFHPTHIPRSPALSVIKASASPCNPALLAPLYEKLLFG